MNLNNVQSFDNSGIALVAYRVAALNSSNQVIYADKDNTGGQAHIVGTILHDRAAADVDPVDVSLWSAGGVHFAMAEAAVVNGVELELGDNGKVKTYSAGTKIGKALGAASGDGSVIRVLVY
jgi:hypothetical protein